MSTHDNLEDVRAYFSHELNVDNELLINKIIDTGELDDNDYVKLLFSKLMRRHNNLLFTSITETSFYDVVDEMKIRINYCVNRDDDRCILVTLMDSTRTNNRIASVASALHRSGVANYIPSIPELLAVVECDPDTCQLSRTLLGMLDEKQRRLVTSRKLFLFVRSYSKPSNDYNIDEVSTQLLVTLEKMNEIDINHSDPHFDEIVVRSLIKPKNVVYHDKSIFSRHIPMIYNWLALPNEVNSVVEYEYQNFTSERGWLRYDEAKTSIVEIFHEADTIDDVEIIDNLINEISEDGFGSGFIEEIDIQNKLIKKIINYCLSHKRIDPNKSKNLFTARQLYNIIVSIVGHDIISKIKLHFLNELIKLTPHIGVKDKKKLTSMITGKLK